MIQNRDTLVLYTCATCNLNCTYCYIDKSPALKQIDQILEESFKGTYYFDFAKEIFPNPKQLLSIEFWGGEPSIGLPRIYHLMPLFIEYYPNFHRVMMSTNLTQPNWFTDFWNFIDIFNNYPKRQFSIQLQLSLDGPSYINDINRGKGVTKKFIDNFETLVKELDVKLPDNIELILGFKQTYSIDTIYKLQTKQAIIDYFTFYDKLIDFVNTTVLFKNVKCPPNLPNTACPSPHTKADGLAFANYCKLCREIEKENLFNNYDTITSFQPTYENDFKLCYNRHCGHCGSGRSVIGLLPEEKISVCHSGFTDIVEEYKQYCEDHKDWEGRSILSNLFTNQHSVMRTCLTKEEFYHFEEMIECYYNDNSTFKMLNLVTLIQVLASVEQIDKKYQNEKIALEAADFFLSATSYCIRDNLNTTGSMGLYPTGLIKLLLNGAKEYIQNNV